MTTVQPRRHRRYKGKEYTVIGVALRSETQEELVVSRQENGDHGPSLRPRQMFLETVKVEGLALPRFDLKEPRMKADPSPKRKMSELISEIAGRFIGAGNTSAEKQNRLTAACSAWNMACAPPETRQRMLDQYVEGYQRFNPATSPSDLAKIRSDMESLIERKLQLFPDDKRQIVSATVVMVGNDYRIEVTAATTQ
jgi:hypothetical protein